MRNRVEYNSESELENARDNLRAKTGLDWMLYSEVPMERKTGRHPLSPESKLVCIYTGDFIRGQDAKDALRTEIREHDVLFLPFITYVGTTAIATFSDPLHIREMANNHFSAELNTEEELIQAKNELCQKTGLNWMLYSEVPMERKTGRHALSPESKLVCIYTGDFIHGQYAKDALETEIREHDVLFFPSIQYVQTTAIAIFSDPLVITEMARGNFEYPEADTLFPGLK